MTRKTITTRIKGMMMQKYRHLAYAAGVLACKLHLAARRSSSEGVRIFRYGYDDEMDRTIWEQEKMRW